MSAYPSDTNANAIILFDVGGTKLNDNLELVFSRTTRIKILREAGYTWGTNSVTIYSKDNQERIEDIEGATYVMGADSNAVVTEMDDDAIFKEKLDDTHTRYKFTLPKLSPGCIIEYRYTVFSSNWHNIKDWTFQLSEPVLWSEYAVSTPPNLQYSGITRGYQSFYINELVEENQVFQGEAAAFIKHGIVKCNKYHWAVADAAALRSEPYITALSDYAASVELQLAGYYQKGGMYVKILESWEKVVSELIDLPTFGERIDASGDVRKKTAEVIAGKNTDQEKANAIYDYVRTTMVWNNSTSAIAKRSPEEVLEAKTGTSGEINFLLMSMLEAAGIPSHPVILSTRGNGKVQVVYPLVNQFDYVIAGLNLNGVECYLDATDPNRGFSLLPMRVLNVSGLRVKDGPVEWATIATDKKSVHTSTAVLTLSSDGRIEGIVESVDEDYEALTRRSDLQSESESEVAQAVFRVEDTDLKVDSIQFTERDNPDKPLKTRARIVGEDYAQSGGDLLYVNPMVINRRKQSPFKNPDRKFPVDMGHGLKMSTSVDITIPPGYQVKEPMAGRSISLPKNAVSYSRSSQIDSNVIHYKAEFQVNKSEIEPNLYMRLRDFYAMVVSYQSEQIVLERVKTPPKKGTGSKSK